MLSIYTCYTITDARAKAKKRYFESLGLKNNLESVCLAERYIIDAPINKSQLEKTYGLLANPLMQQTDIKGLAPNQFNYAVEIGFLPGVTDNIGNTTKETLIDGAKIKFKPGQNVYSSQVFFISGKVSIREIQKITYSLYNPLIQRATITDFKNFQKYGLKSFVPKVNLKGSNKILDVDLNLNDQDMVKLGKLGIKSAKGHQGPLALGLEELKTIQGYFNKLKRKPTDVELEALAQTWSEHCKHTIFADPMDELKDGIYKTYIRAATQKIRKEKGGKDFCVSVFTDNAGGIIFDNDYIICHKVETHNTPSALDPFGGSITGIGGVNRDILGFGLGAKPIANFYGFCLANPKDDTKLYRDNELSSPMLSSRRILDGVVMGINAGGNQSGIPTPLGFLYIDPRFRGKPLVFAGTLGLLPKKINKKDSWKKQAKPGDLIATIGGRVGADGIHGATFSSEGLDKDSPATAVQIGDPITQKKFSDAIAKEARKMNLYNSITDCGAGGLSSAVGEMAKESGGCEVNLDKVPLKYPGLAPWQIWISESQERMVLSIPKNKWQKFHQLMEKRGVEATAIGEFTKSGKCLLKFNKQTVMNLGMDFLHNGRPKKQQFTKEDNTQSLSLNLPEKKDYSDLIIKLLSCPNIASNEFISSQYDHEVQASSVTKPLQGRGKINGEASVIRPVLNSKKGVVISYGLHPSYSELDPYKMASASIDSAIRAAVCAGADIDNLALLDNFCWCSPQDPKRLWQLKQAAKACFDTAIGFGTPFISGKDSMHNDFKGFDDKGMGLKISIPPTLLISALSVIPDVAKTISMDAKMTGDFVYVLGKTNNELGGSEYTQMLKQKGGLVPSVDTKSSLTLYRNFFKASTQNLIASAISVNSGGLAVALSKSLMAGNLGAEINLKELSGNYTDNNSALFSESQGRILVTINPKKALKFEVMMRGSNFSKIGRITTKPNISITNKKNQRIINLNLNSALKSYRSTFKDY